MRTAALLSRNARRLSSMASRASLRPAVKDTLFRAGRIDSSSVWGAELRGADGAFVPVSAASSLRVVRFAEFGTFNEEHANAAVPDENEDEVKSDEHPEQIIEKASQELFRQSNIIDGSEEVEVEEFQVKELGREKPGADIAREVWSAKEQDGTSVFSDHSDKAHS